MLAEATYLPRVWMGSQVSAKLLPRVIRPLSAHIKLTENCQARCISCDYWKSRWQDHLDTERAIDLVDQIGAAGIRSLRLTGGEPLLRRDLFQVLAVCIIKRRCIDGMLSAEADGKRIAR